MTPDFWRNKRVFVTGHTGFKGAWLCVLLRELGATVAGYSRPAPTDPSLFERAGVVGMLAAHTVGDVCDLPPLERAMAAFAPEVVLHMAAQPLVRESYRDPVGTFATNVIGTANVLQACRGVATLKAVVSVTTDKCYENREQGRPFVETDPMGGHDPYSASKGCAELVTSAYRRSFFDGGPANSGGSGHSAARVATARAGNVIGPGDFAADRIIPDCVRALSAGQTVRVRNPNATRPWQHVLEPLAGYLALAEALAGPDGQTYADGWNFGPDLAGVQPVSYIVERVVAGWGPGGGGWAPDPGPHPHEARLLALDTTKARTRLAWRPRLTLDQALHWTVSGYRAILAGDAQAATTAQVHQYLSLPSPP